MICYPEGAGVLRSTGIVRRVDSLGRIVIPVELRQMLGIGVGTDVEMYSVGEDIVLEKRFPGKWLCIECLRLLGEM